MKRVEVEVFSEETNHWILRSPSRRFPALLIQRDSFNSIRTTARRVAQLAASHSDEELTDETSALLAVLASDGRTTRACCASAASTLRTRRDC